MTAKRLILSLMTLAMVFLVGADLASSFGKPQFASRLSLYETDLRLHTGEWQGTDAPIVAQQLNQGNTQTEALTAYRNIRDQAGKTFSQELSQIDKLRRSLDSETALNQTETPQITKLKAQIAETQKKLDQQQKAIDELDLRIGILQAVAGQVDQAHSTWQPMLAKTNVIGDTAKSLDRLWSHPAQPGNEAMLKQGLDSWFRYAALAKQYQVSNQFNQLTTLNEQEQTTAQNAVIKLGFTGGISIVSLITGIGVLIFVIAQRAIKGSETSILGGISDIAWEVQWDWEIIWQVLVVGFFFTGQFLLPVLLGGVQSALGVTTASMGDRARAAWILLSYIGLAGSGIAVLYGSIKSHLPLEKHWFQFDPQSHWWRWGLGGYFAAFPLVVGVSLVNQRIWQGQGGSNPILSIAANNHDPVALGILFFTAAIAAPIFEEILFRGFLLPSLTRYMSTWGAILLSGLIFAVVHLSLAEVLPLMALAIVLGFVYTKTQNLMASMLLHSLWNSGTLVALFLLGGAA